MWTYGRMCLSELLFIMCCDEKRKTKSSKKNIFHIKNKILGSVSVLSLHSLLYVISRESVLGNTVHLCASSVFFRNKQI